MGVAQIARAGRQPTLVAPPMSEEQDAPDEGQDVPAQRGVVVLLVDDSPLVGEAVRSLLHGEDGMVLHFCQNPSAAMVTAMRVQPTVILQDLVMPDVDG